MSRAASGRIVPAAALSADIVSRTAPLIHPL